jgi:glycosyl transferase family 87
VTPAPERSRGISRLAASARPAEIGLVALRVAAVLVVIVGVPHYPDSAAHRFVQIAHAPGTPWRDRPVEYAIGDWIVIRAVGWGSLATARALLALVAFGADLVAWRAVAYGWGRDAAVRYLWLGAPLLLFIYRRSDLVPVALTALALAWARRDRERAGGIALGAAVLTKIWPIVVAPALALERRARALVTAAVAAAGGLVAWVAIGGFGALHQVGTFRGSTGWEIGSTIGVPVWALTGSYRFEEGANRSGTIPTFAPGALLLAAVAAVTAIWLLARRRDEQPAGAPALAAVAALLAFAPVFSPQYVAWLLPWAAVAGGDGRRWTWLGAAPVVITGALVTIWYVDIDLGPGGNQLVLGARNLAVIVIVLWYLVEALRGRRG